MRGIFPWIRPAASQLLQAHRCLPTNKTPFLCVSPRPARCSAPEDALCWLSAPCWPSSPSSCPVEDVRGGSAPWRATCRWLQVCTHVRTNTNLQCTRQASLVSLSCLFSPLDLGVFDGIWFLLAVVWESRAKLTSLSVTMQEMDKKE